MQGPQQSGSLSLLASLSFLQKLACFKTGSLENWSHLKISKRSAYDRKLSFLIEGLALHTQDSGTWLWAPRGNSFISVFLLLSSSPVSIEDLPKRASSMSWQKADFRLVTLLDACSHWFLSCRLAVYAGFGSIRWGGVSGFHLRVHIDILVGLRRLASLD